MPGATLALGFFTLNKFAKREEVLSHNTFILLTLVVAALNSIVYHSTQFITSEFFIAGILVGIVLIVEVVIAIVIERSIMCMPMTLS